MISTLTLKTHNPRVVEWGAPADRAPAEAGEPYVAVVVEAVPPACADAIVRAARRAGAVACSGPSGANSSLWLRGARAAVIDACERAANEPAECALDALAAYPKRRFKLRLRSGALRLGPEALVMGVLNVTPDSFSDGGRFDDVSRAVDHALEMQEQGAAIIDVGGESTRPNAPPVDADEERRRVLPVIEALAGRLRAPISIDTYKAGVARDALAAGAQIINDVTGLRGDPEMAGLAAESGAPVCVMHMRGNPRTMQRRPRYRNLLADLCRALRDSIHRGVTAGVKPQQFIIDPGIGFGKTVAHNLRILRRLAEFRSLGAPILIGPSRKSFIGAALDRPQTADRLWGTLASVAWVVAQGAAIVRVHDAAPARDVVRMIAAIERGR